MRKSLHFVRTERVNFGRNIIEHGTRVANLNSFEGEDKKVAAIRLFGTIVASLLGSKIHIPNIFLARAVLAEFHRILNQCTRQARGGRSRWEIVRTKYLQILGLVRSLF